jgi:hypothetical protein
MNTSEYMRHIITLLEAIDPLYGWDWEEVQDLHHAMNSMGAWNEDGSRFSEEDWKLCMEKLPDSRYTGPMYRGISLDNTVNLKTADINNVLRQVKKYMASHARQVVGWSKDPEIAFVYTGKVGVVMMQTSTGLDLNNLYHEQTDYGVESAHHYEHEVLARTSANVKLYGFAAMLDEDTDERKFFPVDKFAEFQKFIQNIQF